MINSYTLLGAMSGTSLDGLDLACCHFNLLADGKWEYTILAAETISYDADWHQRLLHLMQADALSFVKTDRALGKWMGEQVRTFMNRHHVQPQAVASHGHTVFHQPKEELTVQIGHGFNMMVACGIPVINDFRSLDVALGGHGAPLVPMGDALLFSDYAYCLNLGGIANISATKGENRIAYDICPANGVLNYLARRLGHAYDPDGSIAAGGQLLPGLLHHLNALPYYAQQPPKSLGYEWVEAEALPLIASTEAPVADLLYTVCEHIAQQIALSVSRLKEPGAATQQRLLATGGGAFNKHLMGRIDQHLAPFGVEVTLPDAQTIAFKEALIFAFLGALRLRGEPNCLQSVTGAASDSSGGVIYDNIL